MLTMYCVVAYRVAKRRILRALKFNYSVDVGHIATYYAAPMGCFVVAVDSVTQRVIGTCGLCRAPSKPTGNIFLDFSVIDDSGPKRGVVRRMFVRPEYQQRGVGKQLMAKLLAFSKDAGYDEIVLMADAVHWRAHPFYRFHGFQFGRVVDIPWTDGSWDCKFWLRWVLNDYNMPGQVFELRM